MAADKTVLGTGSSLEHGDGRPVLEIEDLRCEIRGKAGRFFPVDGVSLDIRPGEILALVGESGSGKSLTALAILRLLPDNACIVGGRLLLHGANLASASAAEMRAIRGRRIGMIFQEPQTALNPVLTIGAQLVEAMHGEARSGRRAKMKRALELLDIVGIPDPDRRLRHYPHQLSGGMKQRAMIAMAIACDPDLLVADEPTTALDVTIQAQILDLLDRIRRRTGLAVLLITHDLGVVAETADRVALMYAGKIVELRPTADFLTSPEHPYAHKLLASVPNAAAKTAEANGAPCPGGAHPLLKVSRLCVNYPDSHGLFGPQRSIRVVDGVDIEIAPGRTLALVGESGCGKTTVGKAVLGLVPLESGSVSFEGVELDRHSTADMRRLRARMQIVFQDPFGSMDPRMNIRRIVEEGIVNLEAGTSREERRQRVMELLRLVGLPPDSASRYPHEFSGGQRQRISIARALAVQPRLIVCDEVTSALDLSIQSQILDLLKSLQRELEISYLFITHNLATVKFMADDVAVMYLGKIVESGPVLDIFGNPAHPYTQALLAAEPQISAYRNPERIRLEGELPSVVAPPSGCHFHPRCTHRMEMCRLRYPEAAHIAKNHTANCFLHHDKASTEATEEVTRT